MDFLSGMGGMGGMGGMRVGLTLIAPLSLRRCALSPASLSFRDWLSEFRSIDNSFCLETDGECVCGWTAGH